MNKTAPSCLVYKPLKCPHVSLFRTPINHSLKYPPPFFVALSTLQKARISESGEYDAQAAGGRFEAIGTGTAAARLQRTCRQCKAHSSFGQRRLHALTFLVRVPPGRPRLGYSFSGLDPTALFVLVVTAWMYRYPRTTGSMQYPYRQRREGLGAVEGLRRAYIASAGGVTRSRARQVLPVIPKRVGEHRTGV